MAINLPTELRNFSVDGTVRRPKGERLVARRLSKSDSDHVRRVMGHGSVGVRTPRGVKHAIVKPIGRMHTNAKVAIRWLRVWPIDWRRLCEVVRPLRSRSLRALARASSRCVGVD